MHSVALGIEIAFPAGVPATGVWIRVVRSIQADELIVRQLNAVEIDVQRSKVVGNRSDNFRIDFQTIIRVASAAKVFHEHVIGIGGK